MSKSKKDKNGVRVNGRGYAVGYECHLRHTGNRGYVLATKEWYECQGCGHFIDAGTIRERQASLSICDGCGEIVADIDAGFAPGLHRMAHDCGGTWARL